MKAQVADVFLQKFQLKPEEIQVLRGAKSGTMSQVWKCYYGYKINLILKVPTMTVAFVILFLILMKIRLDIQATR